MSTLSVSSPQTPPLSEFPDYSILSAIGRASHMGLFGGLSRAPAIGSLGWYENMRESGLSDDEIRQIEEGKYNTSSDDEDDEDDSSSEHIAVTIAPPPPPLVRVNAFRSSFLDADADNDDTNNEDICRNMISEFNAVSWTSSAFHSPPSPQSTDSSYSTSSETRYESSSVVEGTLRRVLNAAIDEWNIKIDDCHPSENITVEELQIRNLKMARYRHLITNAVSLLTDTFGCHICRDRRTYRGACANCLEQKMQGPKPAEEHILPIKLKNQ